MHIVAMHIPDGYLGPQTYVVFWLVMIPIWFVAARKVKKTLKTKQIPLLALGAAFSFIIMMFNVPVVGGSTGHAVGATLIAIILGPWAAVIAVSIALVIQAGLFGDGGITALAANCFNMAVVIPFVGYYLYRLICGDAPSSSRRVVSSGVAPYVAIVAGAICAGFEFGIQPYIAHTASGQALYAPYKLSVAVPAMALEHLLFFGFVEAAATMGVVAALARTEPELLQMKPAARPLRWLWGVLGVLILLTPIGVLAPGTAWGEWSSEQITARIGYVPTGFEKLGSLWKAAMPDYATPGVSNAMLGYLIAAVVGTALVVGITWGVGALLARRREGDGPQSRDSAHGARRVSAPCPCCQADIAPAVRRRGRGGRSLARKTADSVPARSPTSLRTRRSRRGRACCSVSTRASDCSPSCCSP